MKNQFDGTGFDQSELRPEELGQFRHMRRVMGENFVALSADHMKTLAIITPVRKAWWMGPTLLVIGAALSQMGFI
jgi:hypothetical protein